jgi:hypothetical protein
MVVDDEPDLIMFYRMSLEYYGFEVIWRIIGRPEDFKL